MYKFTPIHSKSTQLRDYSFEIYIWDTVQPSRTVTSLFIELRTLNLALIAIWFTYLQQPVIRWLAVVERLHCTSIHTVNLQPPRIRLCPPCLLRTYWISTCALAIIHWTIQLCRYAHIQLNVSIYIYVYANWNLILINVIIPIIINHLFELSLIIITQGFLLEISNMAIDLN